MDDLNVVDAPRFHFYILVWELNTQFQDFARETARFRGRQGAGNQ
jgi:hypothetical protein